MATDICLEFVDSVTYTGELHATRTSDQEEGKCGILERNRLVWYARGSLLEVFRNNSEFKVIHWCFDDCTKRARNPKSCTVECVEEIVAFGKLLLAVGLRLGPEQTQIVLLAPGGYYEVGSINLQEAVKIIRFIDPSSCSIGLLKQYSGCLAVGTVDGKFILVDLCLKLVEKGNIGSKITMNGDATKQCHIEFSRGDPKQLARNHATLRERGLYFGLQFSHDVNASVECILDIPPLKATCVGFTDGTVIIVDLVDQSLMHRIASPTDDCPVAAMNYLEPSDDPEACLYLWVFYEHPEGAFATLYMIMCEEKYMQDELSVYDQFQSCSVRFNLPSYDAGSIPLHVQSITERIGDEELVTLSVLSWLGSDQTTTTVLVFDLNQWYKAEMPFECDWQDELTYLVAFQLKESSICARLDEGSFRPFHSAHRPEEHFYPNSLEFDVINYNGFNRTRHHWVGLQRKLLRYLNLDGANGVLEPSDLYQALNRAALMPLFCDPLPCEDISTKDQREFVLSLGLEYQCYTFLQSCANLWADGSHLGSDPVHGVSLSTLTDWIWNRSAVLKEVSNKMLAPLLDSSGPRMDSHTSGNLSRCTEQMKRLAKFYATILSDCKKIIPKNVMEKLTKECSSIAVAAKYLDVVLWLLLLEVLPEVPESAMDASDKDSDDGTSQHGEALRVPYPYTKLSEFYRNRRSSTLQSEVDAGSFDASAGCKNLLYIDNLIEREFDTDSIRKVWFDDEDFANTAAPLYPPESLQKALRVLLIPETAMQQKLVLLSYLFMDIVAVLDSERYADIFKEWKNFPSIFNLSPAAVQRVQAFWHLDHGDVETSVKQFLTPASHRDDYPKWHRELAVSTLLHLNAPKHALLLLRSQGYHISPQLELATLVKNGLIAEAFNLQRGQPQPDGMVWFVETVLNEGKPKALLEFDYTDEEKFVLRSYLRDAPVPRCDSLLFGHLLDHAEFVEAVQHVDRLTRKRNSGMEPYRDILSLYHKSLDPTSQRLAYLTYTEPKELEPRLATPTATGEIPSVDSLSARLIRNRADFRVRILHQSIVAVKEAAEASGLLHDRPFLDKPDLGMFHRRPMVHSRNVSYPVMVEEHRPKNKRQRQECDASYDDGKYEDRWQKRRPLFEEDICANPCKRRNLGSDYNAPTMTTGMERKYLSFDTPVPVIPQFRPMVPKFNFSVPSSLMSTEIGEGDVGESGKSTSHSPSIFLQTPPLFKKKEPEFSVPEDADTFTPPGILKSSQSSQGIAADSSEEKVLRFDLPPGVTVDSSYINETTVAEDGQGTEVIESMLKPEPRPKTPQRRDLDLSGISNEDFYSPEVTMDDNSLQQLLSSGGPSRRRALHDRTATPTGPGGPSHTENIAIIIEDQVDEECLKTSEFGYRQDAEYQEEEEYTPMDVDDEKETSLEENYMVHTMAATAGDEEENVANVTEGDEIISVEDVTAQEVDESVVNVDVCMETSAVEVEDSMQQQAQWNEEGDYEIVEDHEEEVEEERVEIFDAIADQGEDGYEVMVDLDEEPEEASVEEDLGEYDDEEEEEEDEDVEDEGSYEDLEDELHNGELDNSAEEGDDDSVDSSSVLEVIDLSDEDNANTSSSSSSSSSSSDDPHGGAEQAQANTINPVADEPPQQQQQQQHRPAESVEPSVGSVGLQQQILYAELYSDAAPRVIYHQVHIEGEEDEEEKEGGGEQVQRREGDAQEGQASHDIQVPTTSSSTHRTEASGLADSSDDEDEVSEVKDLSVIGQNIAEVADSSMASGALRDRSVAGDQWEDGVASTSGNEEVVSARVVAPSSSGTTAAASVAAPGAQPQTQATQQQQTFGQPKNAHELEVPAMNLSVKPDEAHGSSRKNSKGEENGLSEEARALNLSAGQQQELAAQMARAEAGNNNDGEGEDEIPNVSNDEPQSSDEVKADDKSAISSEGVHQPENEPHSSDQIEAASSMHVEAQENEPHSSDEGKEVNEEERMDLTLHVSDEEDASEMETPPTAGPSSTAEEPKQYSKEVENSPLRRSKEALLQQEETASTSTPRANVKTRLMIAMEKSSGTTPSLGTPTRARGRSGRSTSVVHETTDTPITSALSRSRRYASMDNVSEATPDPTVPLTPRRSTRRASSLAKELFTGGTPQKRTRRQSQSSVESADPRGSVPPTSPPDAAMEPPEPSEKSFASSTASSARRGRRGRKPRAASELPGTSGGSDAPLLADYSSNRRLTRHQLAVMEKSMEISSRSSQARMERGASSSKLDESIETGGADSEGESVVSNVSNQSSVRSTRSRATRAATRRSSIETRSNRGGSVKDSSASHHPTAGASELDSDSDHSMVHGSQRTVHGLEPIAEEGDETRSETGKKRRGRPPKNRQ